MSGWFEREESHLEDELARGNISQAVFNDEMRELERDYRATADEAIEDAAQAEHDEWFA